LINTDGQEAVNIIKKQTGNGLILHIYKTLYDELQ
jgi:hypothetical protein